VFNRNEGPRQVQQSGLNCEPSFPGGSVHRSALKILVAEDEQILRNLIRLMFMQQAHQVVIVANGREAIAAWEQGAFDIILLDVRMPEMDGLEAVRRIRKLEQARGLPRIPVIALTAHTRQEDLEGFIQAGMDDCISKPIAIEELFARIGQYAGSGKPSAPGSVGGSHGS